MIFRLYDMFHMFDMVSLHTQWYKERDIRPKFSKMINKNFEFIPQIFYTHKSEF